MKIYQPKARRNTQTSSHIAFVILLLMICALATNAQSNTSPFPSSGNVGIGTTSPAANLQVESSSSTTIRLVSTGDNVAYQRIQGLQGTADWYAGLFGTADYSIGDITNGAATYLTVKKTTGNVGIGITGPSVKLHVSGSAGELARFTDQTNGALGISLAYDSGSHTNAFVWNQYNGGGSVTDSKINFGFGGSITTTAGTNSGPVMTLQSNSNVGIGTTNPGYKLDVNGDTRVSGDINLTGTINARYQDVAEWVPSSAQLSAGTVVVLDSTKSNQVTSSFISYDTRVAGVVSAQPGIALGEKSNTKVLVATTGRVKVKVDASKGPIHIGDLLVTSDIPGVAMKSEPVNLGGVQLHRPGTLIGKALEPLEKGKGEILVLLSLQ
jgi:hypothetical protein